MGLAFFIIHTYLRATGVRGVLYWLIASHGMACIWYVWHSVLCLFLTTVRSYIPHTIELATLLTLIFDVGIEMNSDEQ